MAANRGNCVDHTQGGLPALGHTYHANFWLAEMSKKATKTIALSFFHTHTISKSAVCQSKLTNVYELDEEKTDLKKSRAFELEWVVQKFRGQWCDSVSSKHTLHFLIF
jgi:hypothetical protein